MESPQILTLSYALGCHAYITKSGDYAQFIQTLNRQLSALLQITGYPQPGDEV